MRIAYYFAARKQWVPCTVRSKTKWPDWFNVHVDGGFKQSLVVRIEEEGKTTVGQAADTDTLVASANAYINALNKMIIKRKRNFAPDGVETKKNVKNEKMRGI